MKSKGQKHKKIVRTEPDRVENPQSNHLLIYGVLIGTFILYINTLSNGFTNWDDDGYITANKFIQDGSFDGFLNLFSSVYGHNYHPLTTLSNWLEYKVWGLNPKPYHFFNIVFHIINVWLVYRFVKHLKENANIALLVALFFAIHPLHVESVAWAAERKDLLYTCFALLSLLYYLKYLETESIKNLLLVGIFFVLSLLSKSAAVILPILFFAIDFYKKRGFNLKLIFEKIPFFALSLVFGLIAMSTQKGAISYAPDVDVFDRFFLLCYSIAYYIVGLFVPFHFSSLHPYPEKLSYVHYLAPFLLAFIAFGIFKARRFKTELVFGILFYFIAIVLILQIIPVGNAVVAERYSYLSSIGIFFIFSTLCVEYASESESLKKYVLPLLVTMSLIFIIQTWARNKVWKDSISLWQDAVDKYPKSAYSRLSLGNTQVSLGDYQNAYKTFDEGISIDSNMRELYVNRGFVSKNLNNIDGAINDFSIVIKKWPNDPVAYFNRGVLRDSKNDWQNAFQDLNKAIALDSNQYEYYLERGVCKEKLKDYLGSIEDYTKSIKLNKNYSDSYRNRGISYYNLKQTEKACSEWKIAASLGNEQASAFLRDYCK